MNDMLENRKNKKLTIKFPEQKRNKYIDEEAVFRRSTLTRMEEKDNNFNESVKKLAANHKCL